MKVAPSGEDPPQDASRRQQPVPTPKKKSIWKKALALAMAPLAALGAGGMSQPGAGLPSPVRTYTLAPGGPFGSETVLPAGAFHYLSSGGEYNLHPDWERLGQAEAVRLATAVVNLAHGYAGARTLGPGVNRYLIQLVLTGAGGINPDEAADVLEFCANEGADLRLGTLIEKINEAGAAAPLAGEYPPENPGPGGQFLRRGVEKYLDFELGGLLLKDEFGRTLPSPRPRPASTDPDQAP
jgi:hypothetical protein